MVSLIFGIWKEVIQMNLFTKQEQTDRHRGLLLGFWAQVSSCLCAHPGSFPTLGIPCHPRPPPAPQSLFLCLAPILNCKLSRVPWRASPGPPLLYSRAVWCIILSRRFSCLLQPIPVPISTLGSPQWSICIPVIWDSVLKQVRHNFCCKESEGNERAGIRNLSAMSLFFA